jgi:hypothetical protein
MWCASQEAFFVPVIARTFETAHIFLLFFCDISAGNQMTSHIVYMTSHLRALTPALPGKVQD